MQVGSPIRGLDGPAMTLAASNNSGTFNHIEQL